MIPTEKRRRGSTGPRRPTRCALVFRNERQRTYDPRRTGEPAKEIEETSGIARAELTTLKEGRQRLEELERDGDVLMERYAGAVPEAIENLTPEERYRVYKMLRLNVVAHPDSRLEVTGVLGSAQEVCHPEPLSKPQPSRSWRQPAGSWTL